MGQNSEATGGAASLEAEEIFPPVDPETQAKLEALFETAGIGKLAGETKQFTDPEVCYMFLFFLHIIIYICDFFNIHEVGN